MDRRTERLLAWYDREKRSFPWRGEKDAYRIWVSEVMLQQTRTETVERYYSRFLEAFPTLEALAGGQETEVLKCWEGLGYYSRARNLMEGARQVMRDYGGVMPADPAELRKIRGIGPYTAGAIASIAYGVPTAAVDGNAVRVICRLYGIEDNTGIPAVGRRIAELAEKLVPPGRPGDYNQAVMDLGARVCIPGTPDCEYCPLRGLCEAERLGTAPELPHLPKAKPPREIRYDLLILYAGDRVLMRRRTEKMLQGLWCFPMLEGWKTAGEREEEIRRRWGLRPEGTRCRGEAKHVFTHQIWRMTVYETEIPPDSAAPEGYALIPAADIPEMPLPTAMKVPRTCVLRRFSEKQEEKTGK